MKLTNAEIDTLQKLIEIKLKEIYNGPEGIEIHFKPEILQKISKKLDALYFS